MKSVKTPLNPSIIVPVPGYDTAVGDCQGPMPRSFDAVPRMVEPFLSGAVTTFRKSKYAAVWGEKAGGVAASLH